MYPAHDSPQPSQAKHINCSNVSVSFGCKGDQSCFGDHLMPNAISMLEVVHDRCFLVCLSPRNPWFCPRPVHVGFVVEKVALGKVFLPVSRFSTVSIIKPTLLTHTSVMYNRCYVNLANDHAVKKYISQTHTHTHTHSLSLSLSLSVRQKRQR
jgi:hypothetical protein